MKCTFCGNTSGKKDSRGCCISCGASAFREDDRVLQMQYGFMSPNEIRREFQKYAKHGYLSVYDLPEIKSVLPYSVLTDKYSDYHASDSVAYVYGAPADVYLVWRNAGGRPGQVPQWFLDDPYPEHHEDWFEDWKE